MSKKEFIVILAITLIVALVWVISDLVHTQSSSKDLPDVKKYLENLDPNFDKQTLDRISSLSTPAPAPSSLPAATLIPVSTPQPTASVSASPRSTITPSATPKPSPTP